MSVMFVAMLDKENSLILLVIIELFILMIWFILIFGDLLQSNLYMAIPIF